jgi:hypothetical protein
MVIMFYDSNWTRQKRGFLNHGMVMTRPRALRNSDALAATYHIIKFSKKWEFNYLGVYVGTQEASIL